MVVRYAQGIEHERLDDFGKRGRDQPLKRMGAHPARAVAGGQAGADADFRVVDFVERQLPGRRFVEQREQGGRGFRLLQLFGGFRQVPKRRG